MHLRTRHTTLCLLLSQQLHTYLFLLLPLSTSSYLPAYTVWCQEAWHLLCRPITPLPLPAFSCWRVWEDTAYGLTLIVYTALPLPYVTYSTFLHTGILFFLPSYCHILETSSSSLFSYTHSGCLSCTCSPSCLMPLSWNSTAVTILSSCLATPI